MKISNDFDLYKLIDHLPNPLYMMALWCGQDHRELEPKLGFDLLAYVNEFKLEAPAQRTPGRLAVMKAIAAHHDPEDHVGVFFREVARETIEIVDGNARLTRKGVNEIKEAITTVKRLYP